MSIEVVGAPTLREAPAAALPRGNALSRVDWKGLCRIGLVAVELLMLLLVVRNFRLAPAAAGEVLKMIAVGFVVHALAPARYRMGLFVGLSLAIVMFVLGWAGGLKLIGVGVALIGITRLPIAWWQRISLLLAAGLVLSFGRAGLIPLGLGQALWPILGSLFMFRMIIYVYDVRHDPKLATWSGALAYFFLLPNPIFPFFPVVDYKTFRRTYYDVEAYRIYQTGVAWMVRGVVHLILYRFVYYYLTIAPEDVQTSSDLTRYIVSNYGLYLRVSGTFHLIVGALHLFGFNLPVTNNLYFLASSFTDYWRRVNIYWKDFMMKVFYYPSYFVLRRTGPIMGLVLATVVVFVATTVLHSYQWFWLRGDWYMSQMDVAFWTVLGLAVIGNVIWEAKRGRKRSLGAKQWTLKEELARVGRVALTFAILSSLWSLWYAPSIAEWFGMWSVWNVGAPVSLRIALLLAAALGVYLFGSYVLATTPSGKWFGEFAKRTHLRESPYLAMSTLALLLVLGSPRVRAEFQEATLLLVVEDLQHDRLNRRDQETLERGYYENLFGVENANPELATLYSREQASWVSLWKTDAVRSTGDLRRIELVPDVNMLYKGVPFTTNAFGMRDRARSRLPEPGVYRFAVLGASTTMGSGVRDDEHYPALVEAAIPSLLPGVRAELMNFAVESYNAVEQAATVDQRVFDFGPHAIVYIAHETEFEKTLNSLSNMVDDGTEMVYPELARIIADAGLEAGTPHTIALRSLGAQRDQILGWAYRQIAEQARARGVLPIWAFVPMPVAGTGPCPPGSAQLFCFGNTSRVGAAADASDPRVNRLFQLAREAGFVTLDLSNVYGSTDLKSLWIAETDGHPNVAGHRMIADGLAAALTSDPTIIQDINRITARSN